MAKGKNTRILIGPGPECPRCHQTSQIVQHGEGRHAKNFAHCKNPACATKVFPLNSKKLHLDRVRLGDGPPCFRCLAITTAWRHPDNWTPPAGKGHYSFWYQCMNDACLTNQIMPPEAFVRRKAA